MWWLWVGALWCGFGAVQWAANVTVLGPIAAGGEANLVGYFALGIVATLALFTLWAVVSWVLSVAPLLAMLRGLGVGESLAAAFRLGQLKGKLVERNINLVMGIVKIALIVLAMVFSVTPLPFESVTTPELSAVWWRRGICAFIRWLRISSMWLGWWGISSFGGLLKRHNGNQSIKG